jgi:hypothetical protein
MDSDFRIPPLEPADMALMPVLIVRLATLLSISQVDEVLSWRMLTMVWRGVFEEHRRWALATRHGIVDGGDQP